MQPIDISGSRKLQSACQRQQAAMSSEASDDWQWEGEGDELYGLSAAPKTHRWVKILQAPRKGEPCHIGKHVVMMEDAEDKKMADVDKVTPPTEEVVEEDPGRVAPPEHDLWKASLENNGCTICGKRSRGEPNPLVFTKCWICGDSPAYHHGRCCPARVGWASGQLACTDEQTWKQVQQEQLLTSRPPPNAPPF